MTLEYTTFEDLPGGRSLLTGRSVFPDLASRDRYLTDGMERGISEGYDRLEEVLANKEICHGLDAGSSAVAGRRH